MLHDMFVTMDRKTEYRVVSLINSLQNILVCNEFYRLETEMKVNANGK
jgi:hypothetical protein